MMFPSILLYFNVYMRTLNSENYPVFFVFFNEGQWEWFNGCI